MQLVRRTSAVPTQPSEVRVNTVDSDAETRARIQQHWDASERGDIETEHAIYAADAILDCRQSGERFSGRSRIQYSAAGSRPNATSPSAGSPLGQRVRDHL
jgi:hypothetical protein